MSSKLKEIIFTVEDELTEKYLRQILELFITYKNDLNKNHQRTNIESENEENFDQIPVSKPRNSIFVDLDYDEEIESPEENNSYEKNVKITTESKEEKENSEIYNKNHEESSHDEITKKTNSEDKIELMEVVSSPGETIFDESTDEYQTAIRSKPLISNYDKKDQNDEKIESIIEPNEKEGRLDELRKSPASLERSSETVSKTIKNQIEKNIAENLPDKNSINVEGNPEIEENPGWDRNSNSSKSITEELPPGKIKCDECGKIIRIISYANHKTAHKNEKLGLFFYCHLCPYKSVHKRTLLPHLKYGHKIDSKSSQLHSSIIRRNSNQSSILNSSSHQPKLMNSSILHKNETSKYGFKCPKCNMTFISVKGLKIHNIRVHNDHNVRLTKVESNPDKASKVKCNDCGDKITKTNIYRHMEMHKIGNIECKVCHAKFTSLASMNRHSNNHDKNSTKQHERIKCDECEKMVSVTFYGAHKKHHEMIKLGMHMKCNLCGFKTLWKGEIYRHFKDKHNGEETCYEICRE